MSEFDFKNAQLPELKPLQKSFTQNDVEEQLKDLFISTFKDNLAKDVFNVNVLGAAQLGSYELVQRAINSDGLVLLKNDAIEDATRYLYRAWMSRNNQGRGLHFLRTYLQLLFPNVCNVYQCWQKTSATYPSGLVEAIPEGGDIEDYFLTSRLEIALTFDITAFSLKGIRDIIRSIVPARLVPEFRFILIFDLAVKPTVDYYLEMTKESNIPMFSNALYVTTDQNLQFIVTSSNPKLLGSGQVQADLSIDKESEISLSRIIRVGQPGLKVLSSGYWNVCKNGPFVVEGTLEKLPDE